MIAHTTSKMRGKNHSQLLEKLIFFLSYEPFGPTGNFFGKPYEKKSRLKAVHLK